MKTAASRLPPRRPLREEELVGLMSPFDSRLAAGADVQSACRTVVQGLLASPQFLSLSELHRGKHDGPLRTTNDVRLSRRQILELHRAQTRCVGCHRTIDPLGFALEHFDAIGRWREREEGTNAPIDASATLPDGTTLGGFADLKHYLTTGNRRRSFVRNFNRQLAAYALTRTIEGGDYHTLEQMRRALERNEYRFSAAVIELVRSNVFRYRADR